MLSKFRSIIKAWSPTERHIFYAAVSVFVLASTMLSIRLYFRLTIEIPDFGGEYLEGLVGQPTIINPVIPSGNDVDRDLTSLLFSGLGILSEEIKTSEDGRIWTVALKKDLKWSDGEPLTSDDVLYTTDAIQDINTRSPLIETWRGVVVERLSEKELKFTIKTPYAFFADNIRGLKIIPHHIFSIVPNSNMRLSNFNLEPVGSGPFVFRRYEKRKDGFITDFYLDRNENYAGDKSLIDKFHIVFLQNSSEAIDKFNTLMLSGFGALDARELVRLKAGFNEYRISLPRYYAIFMNQGTHPALKERDVRAALARATNRAAIVTASLGGQAEAVYGPILPSIEGYDAQVYEKEIFSTDEAGAILENAKWIRGEDGVREKIYGKNKIRLEFELVVPQIPFLIATANAIKDDWAKIGAKAVVVSINPAEINDAVIKTRNYHMLLFGNILSNNPDVFAFWHSSERFYPGQNLAVYENKKLDILLETIRRDLNKETRAINIKKLQETILADRPAIILFSPTYLYIATKNLRGFSPNNITAPAERFNDASHWYIRTKRVLKSG